MVKDKFEEFAVDLKNEADAEEELDGEVLKREDIEKEHFEEDNK